MTDTSIQPFTELADGNITDALIHGFTLSPLGNYFYVILLAFITAAIYLKTESIVSASIFLAILSGMGLTYNLVGVTEGTANISMIGIYAFIFVVGLALPLFYMFRRD